jgi:hypothetical protein
VVHREPIKVFLWSGPPFTRSSAIGELRDPELVEDIYRWHLVNRGYWIARQQDYYRKHPNAYQGIKWNVRYVTNWGGSIEFRRTFAATVHWINVYDPGLQKTGINVEVLTGGDARRYDRIWEARRFISTSWWVIAYLLVLIGLWVFGGAG